MQLSIGDFSRITHLSVRTLRRYHEAGLLEPDTVDARSGYRYYSPAQVASAQVVRRFRDLGMPVAEVKAVLAADPAVRADLIAGHLERLEAQLDETRAAVTSLRRLLAPPPLTVELRTEPARTVAAVVGTIDHTAVPAWFDGAVAELQGSVTPTGPLGGRYDDALFAEGSGEAVLYLPTDEPPRSGRVHPLLLPAVDLALTVHVGAHDDVDVTYGALGAYVTEQAMALAGPVHEIYLVGPRDTPDPAEWRTEIGWPVFRTSS
jgi:DNA-binding transcriptional MerR regulator